MRLHRFFIHDMLHASLRPGAELRLDDKALIHQLKDVFRLRAGDDVILLDNTGHEYISTISELHKAGAGFRVIDVRMVPVRPKRDIVLACSLIKKDNFEWILEKGTELGVSSFVPVLSERSEKKNFNRERSEKIIREASEQSGRGLLPQLHDMCTLETCLELLDVSFIAFDPDGAAFDASQVSAKGRIVILIGPEGGWSDTELELFAAKNISVYSTGLQILRAETAAIAIASLLLL